MAAVVPSFVGFSTQFLTNAGTPLVGGQLFTYAAGTTTPVATYTTSVGTVAQANPIVLDSAGRVPNGGEIWLLSGTAYKFVLEDANNNVIATWDNIQPMVTQTSGTFTLTFNTGLSVACQLTATYTKVGNLVTLSFVNLAIGTGSNTVNNTTSAATAPSAIWPATARYFPVVITNNGAPVLGWFSIATNGYVTLYLSANINGSFYVLSGVTYDAVN